MAKHVMVKEWYTEKQKDHVLPLSHRAAGTEQPAGLDGTVKKAEKKGERFHTHRMKVNR